jgi:hypothetical protein
MAIPKIFRDGASKILGYEDTKLGMNEALGCLPIFDLLAAFCFSKKENKKKKRVALRIHHLKGS